MTPLWLAAAVSAGMTLAPAPDTTQPVSLTESPAMANARCQAALDTVKAGKADMANPAMKTCLAALRIQGDPDAKTGPKETGPETGKDTGMALLQSAADAGYAPARLYLAYIYRRGKDVPRDLARAAAFDKAAADSGSAEGQREYAEDLGTGRGVPRDEAQAMIWLQRAATGGEPRAQTLLGQMYLLGDPDPKNPIPKDPVLGAKWLKAAAGQSSDGAYVYGRALFDGIGMTADPAAAIPYLQQAADAYDEEAQFILAEAYLDGKGVTKNETRAARYYAMVDGAEFAPAMLCHAVAITQADDPFRDASACSPARLTRAAANGIVAAQRTLARNFSNGHNDARALMWYDVAAKAPGLPDEDRDIIAKRLGPDDDARAQAEADAFAARSAQALETSLAAYHGDIGKPVSDVPPGFTLCQELDALGTTPLPADCTAWFTLPAASNPGQFTARLDAVLRGNSAEQYGNGWMLARDMMDGKAGIPTAADIGRLSALSQAGGDGGWSTTALGVLGPWARSTAPMLEARLAAQHVEIGKPMTGIHEGEFICQALLSIGTRQLPADCTYWLHGITSDE